MIGGRVTNVFTVLGAIATILSTYIVYYAYFKENSAEFSASGVGRLHEAAAKIVAPSGFVV